MSCSGESMKDNVFRTYDIRGIVDKELVTEEVYDLGKAIVTYFRMLHPQASTVLIGRDGREHSPIIHRHLIDAITDLGYDVVDVGIVLTPALYFAVHHLNLPCALMITASHNPKEYNGIKIWGVSGARIQEIKEIYKQKKFLSGVPEKKGVVRGFDILSLYLSYLADHFPSLKNVTINAVIDCGNGATGTIIPALIKKMNWQNVELLFPEVDGTFPNHEADPTKPENMTFVKNALANNSSLTLGIGFDGDGDRMNPMTKQGVLVPGDQLLALYAKPIIQQHPHAAVVFDIKSSSSLVELLEQWGARPVVSPSGHSFIKTAIQEHNALLGGELSCHFFFNDRYFGYDDGVYAALRLLELIQESKQSLDQLLRIIPVKEISPEIRLECHSDKEKEMIVDQVKKVFCARRDAKIIALDGIKAHMPYGWGLIRASNTQPVICLRFESSTKEGLQRLKQEFYHELSPFFDQHVLKEALAL